MTERVKISIDDHIAIVTLNRPDKHNAVDLKMFEALAHAGNQLAEDQTVRAVVLEGAGPSFCAGVDLDIFRQSDSPIGGTAMSPGENTPANFFQRADYVWREIPVPVICSIHGIAYGAWLQIALGADLRYATADSRLSVMEIKWGIIPDMAISTTLPGLMTTDRIKELAWTGRIVQGEEACALGLITAVHENPSQVARDTALVIASKSPDAIRAIKALFDEASTLTDEAALQLEARLQLSLLGSPNQVEAVTANLQKRSPEFEDTQD